MNKKYIITLLFSLYFIFFLLSKTLPETITVYHFFGVGVLISIIVFSKFKKKYLKIASFIFFLAIISLLNNFSRHNYSDYPYSILMLIFPAFVIIINENLIYAKAILMLLYSYSAFVIYNYFFIQIDLNLIFDGASRNLVGWFSILLCCIYYFISKINNDKIRLIPALLNLFICILAMGRSSILTSFFLLLVILYEIYLKRLNIKRVLHSLILISFVSAVVFYYIDFFSFNLSHLTEKELDLTSRNAIWSLYFEKISDNPIRIINGYSRFENMTFDFISNNFHNSFILGHSNFGLIFIFFIIYLIYNIVLQLKSNFMISSLLIVLLVRSFTDTLIFISYFDFIIYALLFYLISNRKLDAKMNP